MTLKDFIRESNRIEGIHRAPTRAEIAAHDTILNLPIIQAKDLVDFVAVIAPGKLLRTQTGMDVRVGNHVAPRGGPEILPCLESVLTRANMTTDSYTIHRDYETLHPFMDGNGRSGRALWLWMMMRTGNTGSLALGFLHVWYYQSLQASRP